MVLTGIEALLTLWPNGILILGHEGDLLHMIDAGIRMVEGETPHLDFMTPIGILGFAPLALFLNLGSAAGQAAVLANLLVCVVLLPATWWAAATRMTERMAWLFGAMIIVLSTAMVHGDGSMSIGFSMYYNRWSWAVAIIMLVILLFPPRKTRGIGWVDPIIIGLGMSMLALTKMTFFVPLVPAVVLILLSSKRYQLALRSILVGAVVAAIVTAKMGVEFVQAYANDLLTVASGGAGRDYPGLDLAGVLSNPEMIPASLVLIGSVIYFRKVGKMQQGLVMFILAPVFVYITFQNWGNDPKWLYFTMLYLAANLPAPGKNQFMGLPARQAGIVLITIAMTAAIPSLLSLASSTSRAAFASFDDALKIPLPDYLADLWMPKSRILVTDRVMAFVNEDVVDSEDDVRINGATLPECKIEGGFIALTNAMNRELETITEANGKQVLTADVLNVGWLMGDMPRVQGAAAWYYDDRSGFDAADYLLVPTCPLKPASRAAMVEGIQQDGWRLEMRYASRLMTLYRIVR